MRRAAIALALVGALSPALATPISVGKAASHVGQSTTVEGVVSDVHTSRSGVTFLDFGGRYPDNAFTGVILEEDAGNFGDVQSLSGRTVSVTGQVQLYRGKPEIIIRSAGQLKVK